MKYRRKLILSMLEEFGRKFDQVKFQRTLFLISRKQATPTFDFVPHNIGCYSFQAYHDLVRLWKSGLIKHSEEKQTSYWVNPENDRRFFNELEDRDQEIIQQVKQQIEDSSAEDLARHVYLNFPEYATRSELADTVLSREEIQKIEHYKIKVGAPAFFTIGYQGISLENYLNKLIRQDVKLLADVRNNPMSRKFGFAKPQLKTACESLGIKYVHIPQLGIEQDKRKSIQTAAEYQALFDQYEKTTLQNETESLAYLKDLITKHRRVAITCYEEDPQLCHRSRLSKVLSADPQWNIPIEDL